MSMLLACQMRELIQKNIKKYGDGDVQLTPKELGELARAAKDVASFAGEVYQAGDPISDTSEEKQVTPAGETPDVDFNEIVEDDK